MRKRVKRVKLPLVTASRTQPILDEMARHREQFEAFCRSLSADELATMVPGAPWSVHGYIAHLATIDSLICAFFGRFVGITDIAQPDPPPGAPFDLDDWNEAIVSERAGASVDTLLREAARHRANYVRVLEALGDAQLDTMVPFGGDRKVVDLPPTTVRLEDILGAIAIHDATHTQDILRALPQREPAVHEWLASVDFGRVPEAITARRA